MGGLLGAPIGYTHLPRSISKTTSAGAPVLSDLEYESMMREMRDAAEWMRIELDRREAIKKGVASDSDSE